MAGSEKSASRIESTSAGSTGGVNRRAFMAASATAVTLPLSNSLADAADPATPLGVYHFGGANADFHGHQWQTLNPGYWKIEGGALRRRLQNYGDRARRTGFPFHGETNKFEFKTDYDPSLPTGILYATEWELDGEYTIKAKFTYRQETPAVKAGDDPAWSMYQDGYGLMGIAIGGGSLLESYGKLAQVIRVVWSDDQKLKILASASGKKHPQGGHGREQDRVLAEAGGVSLSPGDQCELTVRIAASPQPAAGQVVIRASLQSGNQSCSVEHKIGKERVAGFAGIVARGLMDFEVNEFKVDPGSNQPRRVGVVDCLACYALGDTLQEVDGVWKVRMVGLFASDGEQVQIRVADSVEPQGGWAQTPVAGAATIVNNQWRRHTAVVDVTLPRNPADATQYYTVWKDGVDVTTDGRVGTAACGPGTGLVGDVPVDGRYVGRLPRLVAPYRLCGLSCHAITSGLQQRKDGAWKISGQRDHWQYRDQPSEQSYKHLDEYGFQVMLWEDDVWYMELVMYPPSTDDAYKIIAWSICGPTSRWQMMRHWNVLNPGDHDYGMDDVKGPEQIAIRSVEGLGQDPAYMQRNFQIVHHLTTGAEQVDPYENPKKWRAWKMPNRDFTLVVLDSRLWRSSQDVDIWDDQGWGKFKNLYGRTDPTRSLLGEEQFGWLQELIATDSSPLIAITGINGLHTVWAGTRFRESQSTDHPKHFHQRDRVTADYAGWVKAGADRVLELLGSRSGVVSVYGDVHNGCIMKNVEHRVIECSFGPIGRSGGRALVPGFGPKMKDVDDRELEVFALYHKSFIDPDQTPHEVGDPFYWNFLEMRFDPSKAIPKVAMRIRNLIDAPTEVPRGGGFLDAPGDETGRLPTCRLPSIQTLADADVFFTETNGRPIRGTRSDANGQVHLSGLPDLAPGTRIVVSAYDGKQADAMVVTTEALKN
ncbi:MAG: alkaline phosphatase D family protein [Rubripirellula sp.]|nr:alkaline phosphatase D family protein [Rubripirellula sp.]